MSKNILLLAPSCSFKWWSRRAARPPHPHPAAPLAARKRGADHGVFHPE
jgi:hypothetical protein